MAHFNIRSLAISLYALLFSQCLLLILHVIFLIITGEEYKLPPHYAPSPPPVTSAQIFSSAPCSRSVRPNNNIRIFCLAKTAGEAIHVVPGGRCTDGCSSNTDTSCCQAVRARTSTGTCICLARKTYVTTIWAGNILTGYSCVFLASFQKKHSFQ
jgi:hypothetical protein